MIAEWLRSIVRSVPRWMLPNRASRPNRPPVPIRRRPANVLVLKRWSVSGAPTPPLHWVPCHPATVARFKATVVCSRGHTMTLKQHAVDADGAVWPSLVCHAPGCEFHRYVQLDGWTGGAYD